MLDPATQLEALWNAPVGFAVFDADLRYVRVNEALAEIDGVPADGHVGRTIDEVLPGHSIEGPEHLRRVRETGVPVDVEVTGTTPREPGVQRHWRVSYFPIRQEGRVVGVGATVVEITSERRRQEQLRGLEEQRRLAVITDRKRAEEALRASEEKFRSVFEQAAIGMGRVSFSGARWIDVNDAFCRMLGYTREEMLRTPWPEMTHPDDLELDLVPFRRMARGELRTYTVEKRFIHRCGQHVWARLTLSLVRDALGRPDYEIAIIEDIGDRKSAERALADANARLLDLDQRKNEFLAMLSHELRNPLAPIRNSLFVLEHAAPRGQQAQRAHDIIARQVTHMARLIDDLLDVTRISRGKIRLQREAVELAGLVRRTAEDHRSIFADAGVALDVVTCEMPLWTRGDPTRLSQVVGNLLANAVKFTGRGGRVTLSLEAHGGSASIRVEDDGAGIAPEVTPRLFEPFVQADATLDRTNGGLGLGLALVKALVELHGGAVSARSDGPGTGAEFTVSIPLEDAPPVAAPATRLEKSRSTPLKTLRILVIEDNLDAAESLKEALELNGHAVETAGSGPDGIEKARAVRPDVILCDIGLPGIDGFEVARRMRADAELGSIPLVALSGYAGPEDVERSKEAGFDEHMAKPPDLVTLESTLSEASRAGPR